MKSTDVKIYYAEYITRPEKVLRDTTDNMWTQPNPEESFEDLTNFW